MNDRHDKRAQLIAETFHDDWASGPAAGFARAAAAQARSRRRAKAVLSGTGIAALAAVAGFIATRSEPAAIPVNDAKAVAVQTIAAPHAKPTYEIISDEELMAQLPDLAVLIEPDGHGGKRYTLLQPSSE